ncbi:MAG: galactofuranose transport system ATP-binding protein [Actinomycetota bacterium]|nr:galactofuranose transport system ATP-binding protein [Actinomycetota bacterium]MDQ1539401.1 galactofuranose transport system ATP-binding protein [Actinomycetota bacterium]
MISEQAPVLEVAAVTKRFPGVTALDELSFSLLPGEIHALVGENGAGKSTLVKVITGVCQADAGEVRYNGQPISFRSPLEAQRAGISTIYQEVNLVPMMSVARNLFLNREPRRFGLIDFKAMKRQAREVLHGFGLDVNVSRPVRSLGLGTQQMVAIARAIQVEARVVIMDEPTSSLERREVETLFRVMRRLRDAGIAVLYVTHRLDELYEICDRVTVVRDGKAVGVEPVEVLDRLRLVSLMLGREVVDLKRRGVTAFDPDQDGGGDPVLRVSSLTRRSELHDISFQIRPGEVVGLAGLLGSGRSETARAIAGVLGLDSGVVEVGGQTVRRRSASAAIKAGAVMLPEDRQAEGIVPNLSVRENIVLAALPRLSRFGLVTRSKQDEIVDFFMKRLRIKASSPEQKVSELSGGNQQKVLLARWMCLNPKVMLLDEPTRGIDVGAKAELQGLIDDLARQGLGVLLISSELEELIEGCDRVVVLKEGRIVGHLTAEHLDEENLMEILATGSTASESASP